MKLLGLGVIPVWLLSPITPAAVAGGERRKAESVIAAVKTTTTASTTDLPIACFTQCESVTRFPQHRESLLKKEAVSDRIG